MGGATPTAHLPPDHASDACEQVAQVCFALADGNLKFSTYLSLKQSYIFRSVEFSGRVTHYNCNISDVMVAVFFLKLTEVL